MRSVVITGVSTGIGHATARLLLDKGYKVYGSVRKQEDADRLAKEFGPAYAPLLFDVLDQPAVKAAATRVRQDLGGTTLAGLVLNAGIAVPAPLLHISEADLRRQMDVNVIAPAMVAQAFVPLLGSDRSLQGVPGRVVGISSVAGKLVIPFFGPYAGSKHAFEAALHALRMELAMYGIQVAIVAPGSVATPIWGKADAEAFAAYAATDYGPALQKFQAFAATAADGAMPAAEVAAVVLEALTVRHPKLRYAPVQGKFANWILPRLLPRRLLDKAMTGQFGLQPKG